MPQVDRDRFWNDGYLHSRNVFDADEIANIRALVFKRHETKSDQKGPEIDLLSDPLLAHVLLDARLVKLAESLLDGPIVYFGDSHYRVSGHKSVTGSYHKDNVDRLDPSGPDWTGQYPIIRLGIYLQDHRNLSGGVIVRKGSHNSMHRNRKHEVIDEEIMSLATGRNKYVRTDIGDVVTWCLRTTHGGTAQFVKGMPWLTISERFDRFFPNAFKAPQPASRGAVFMTFGCAGPHLDRYIDYLKTRTYAVDCWKAAHWSDDVRTLAASRGVTIRDMPKEIEADIAAGRDVGQLARWKPQPY